MTHRLQVSVTFHLHSPVHITGERAELYTDKALLLDPCGQHALIPATTLKGWFRESIERALRGMDLPACDGTQAELMCGQCLVCQLFGHPRGRAPLRFSDVRLGGDRDVRMNVSLSRHRRVSYEERLFSTEVAWFPEFVCDIDGTLHDVQLAKSAAALLYLGAKMGFALGAARSRGLGWVALRDYQARLDNQLLPISDLVHHLHALAQTKQESQA